MGNKYSQAQKPKSNLTGNDTISKEYTPSFQLLSKNPNFFIELIHQNPLFVQNLFHLFPLASKQLPAFLQMILFLRKGDSNYTINQYAKNNSQDVSILDRFFMIVLKMNHAEYQKKKMNKLQLQNLLNNFFMLFVKQPQKEESSFQRLLKFIHIQIGESQEYSVLQFTTNLKEYFPYIDKYLRQFYLVKFKNLQKEGHILKKFTSKIIKKDAIILALKYPKLSDPEICQLYSTQRFGIGFQSIYKQIVGYTGPWMILVHHSQKNQKGQKQNYVLGAYQNGPIRDVTTSQGDITGFVFSAKPHISFFTTSKGNGGKNYFYLNSIPQQKSKKRKGLGFGGNDLRKDFKLWIDQDIEKSTVFNCRDETYGLGSLVTPSTSKLNIKRIQIWGLGNEYNLQQQRQYWQQRQQQIDKRRKVDKKEFLGNAELFMENTFKHRSQVIGQMPKKQQKQ